MHQPLNPKYECGLGGGPKYLSFNQSANLSIVSPAKTRMPPTIAQNTAADSPPNQYADEDKAFMRFHQFCNVLRQLLCDLLVQNFLHRERDDDDVVSFKKPINLMQRVVGVVECNKETFFAFAASHLPRRS